MPCGSSCGEGGSPDLLAPVAGRLIGQDPRYIERLWQDMNRAFFYPAGREKTDAIILSFPAIEALDREGRFLRDSRADLGHASCGVAVRDGMMMPNIATVESFKRMLHNAGSIAANDPVRPLLVAAAAAIAYLALAGITRARTDLRRHAARFVTPLALVLACSPALAGLARNSWTAGGSDAYAYVSQAEGWLHLTLKTPAPIASSVPWPDAVWTFTPHGYRSQ